MNLHLIVVQITALLLAITVHELAHGWSANRLGDNTARLQGRLTLNPLAHIDIFGTVIFPALLILLRSPFLFGWAKPVPVNAGRFRNPRRDMALVSLSGPASNLALAAISGLLIRFLFISHPARVPTTMSSSTGGLAAPIYWFLLYSLSINVVLAVFNMIPIPPLDGSHFLEGLLPEGPALALKKLEPFGMIILFAFLYLGLLDLILRPVNQFFLYLFLY